LLHVILTKLLKGLDRLLSHSMQDAFYNSASRWPPPKCHYDSRQELRTTIKLAAQVISHSSCYGCMAPLVLGRVLSRKAVQSHWRQKTNSVLAENKLCASIFFSRPNRRNNPDHVFTSIAYQLAVKFPPIGDILDRKTLKDPTVLTAARPVQFEELLVKPLQQIIFQNVPIEGWVIILDGLDEIDVNKRSCAVVE